MAEMELKLTARAVIERVGEGHVYVLVLDDGVNQVRMALPPASQDCPFPHQLVEALGWRITQSATSARRLALDYLPRVAT